MTERAAAEFASSEYAQLPLSERVLDKLADILFATDEILAFVRMEERAPDERTRAVTTSIRTVYEEVNELMKKLAD